MRRCLLDGAFGNFLLSLRRAETCRIAGRARRPHIVRHVTWCGEFSNRRGDAGGRGQSVRPMHRGSCGTMWWGMPCASGRGSGGFARVLDPLSPSRTHGPSLAKQCQTGVPCLDRAVLTSIFSGGFGPLPATTPGAIRNTQPKGVAGSSTEGVMSTTSSSQA